MFIKLLAVCFFGLALVGCKKDGESSTYTEKEIKAAWEKDGEKSPVVVQAAKDCQDDLDKGLGHMSQACRNYESVSLGMARKKYAEDALNQNKK